MMAIYLSSSHVSTSAVRHPRLLFLMLLLYCCTLVGVMQDASFLRMVVDNVMHVSRQGPGAEFGKAALIQGYCSAIRRHTARGSDPDPWMT